ncbi:MAG: hypothetical protein RLZZ303_154 [Candidatus Hydrogenedentota bacterium]|jgi:hypothetical protein
MTANLENLGSNLVERHGGTLETVSGIHVVHIRGSYEAMGRQYAALSNEVCGDVISQYLNCLIEKLVGHAVPPLATPVAALLKRIFHFRNAHRIGPDMLALLAGTSEGFGVPRIIAERLLLVPDILHYLAGRSFVPLAVPPMCSGLYATGSATRDGKQLFARNFDFFGRKLWNACNALVVLHPTSGQRICWIGALGSPSGPQGFNESGLVLSLNTHFTRDVSTKGIPLFSLCHKILANCTTLEEGIQAIESEPRLCGLTIFLLDTKARKAAAVGFSARHNEVLRPEHDVLVRTNHYTTEAMQRLEVAPYPWQRNSRGRFRRVHELVAGLRGELAPEHLPAILSDCKDTWEERTRVTGNVLACANTTQSMVMSPDDDALWLANADHPVSHADSYAGFSISALLNGDREHYVRAPLAGGSTLDSTQRAALHEYEEAWSEHFDNNNNDKAVFHLRRAAALLPEEVIFPRMAGILLLKQHRYEQALPLLMRNTEYVYKDALMHGEAHMWVARCLDLMGRHVEAVAHYQQVSALNIAPLSAAAARHIRKPFGKLGLVDVSPEFICGTALAKYKA